MFSFLSLPTSADAGQPSLHCMQVSIFTGIRFLRAHSFIWFPGPKRRSELYSALVIRADPVLPCYFQKCVPGPRRCVRCARVGTDCIYEQVKRRDIGKILGLGEACTCCRLVARTHMEIL